MHGGKVCNRDAEFSRSEFMCQSNILIKPSAQSDIPSLDNQTVTPNDTNVVCVLKSGIRNCKMGKIITVVEPVNIYDCHLHDDVFVGPFVEIQVQQT
jgi:hypothetical protein